MADPRQPEVHDETVTIDPSPWLPHGGRLTRLVHDGPCVFVDGQCSCGFMDLGVVSGPDHELQPGEPTLHLLETCDGPGGAPWDHPWLDRLEAWWHRLWRRG